MNSASHFNQSGASIQLFVWFSMAPVTSYCHLLLPPSLITIARRLDSQNGSWALSTIVGVSGMACQSKRPIKSTA